MSTQTEMTERDRAMATWSVYPLRLEQGERPLIFTHEQYRGVRLAGRTEDYAILMRRPEEDTRESAALSEAERWEPIPAKKYLKHRANEWREAASTDELPERWIDQALGLETAVSAVGEAA